jgi:hypothetical protein
LRIAFRRPHTAKGRVEGFLLLGVGQLGDQQCVADGDFVLQERLGDGRNQVRQLDAALHVGLALSGTGRDAGEGVSGLSEFEERLETERFFERVNVLALQVLNLSLVLKEHSTT